MPDSFATVIARLGLSVSAVFVPYSKSRSFDPKAAPGNRSLNWIVTIEHKGCPIYDTEYTAGIAHCPSYGAKAHGAPGFMSVDRAAAIAAECETGRSHLSPFLAGQTAILPDSADVLACLAMDCSALDFSGFEEWAADYGYDTDSRKAKALYRDCLSTALALRAALGDAGLSELRDAASEH